MNGNETLDRSITIQIKTVTRDDYGAETIEWNDLVSVWSRRSVLRGSEKNTGQSIGAEIANAYTIRYRSDITELMRIKDGSDYYNINYIAEVGRKEGLILTALRCKA